MARRPKREEHDNNERWMVSYADFITLLFAFFVVMYGISSVNEGKYRVFSVSMNRAFGSDGEANTESGTVRLTQDEMYFKSLVDRRNARLAEKQRKLDERMQKLLETLNVKLAGFVKNGQMTISQTTRGVVLEINASMLFKGGDANLQPQALGTLADVAKELATEDMAIEVQGHTDNLPISTPQFPSNWELSATRASSVVRLFIDHGVAAKRLTASGAADNIPLASNDTPEGRARNRRVTVTALTPEPQAETEAEKAANQ